MTNSSSQKALKLVRSQLPPKVFQMLKAPLEHEFTRQETDDPIDVLMSISDALETPAISTHLDPVKRYLITLASETDPSGSLHAEVEAMTLDGVINKDPQSGCPGDPLLAALYAVSMLYPLQTPEARLNSITQAFWSAAQQMLNNDI